jgi:cell wall-associated NlpC family hydrolase
MRRSYAFTTIFIFIIIFISVNVQANVTYIKEGNNPPKIAKKNKKQTHRKNKNKHNLTSPPLSTTFHKVKKGDTLLSLSKKYPISVSELKEINNLRSTKIRIGQKVLLKRSGAKTYTVKQGDNIWKIARRFNIEEETEGVLESEEYSLEEKVTLLAKKLLNIPYSFGGSSIHGIDCSAFVKKVYGMVEINLPRSAREQFSKGTSVDKEELSVGDLVFFRTYASFPSHVGIYLGNNLFIHASSKDKKVTIDSLETPYYMKRFIGGKKIIEEKDDKEKLDEKG